MKDKLSIIIDSFGKEKFKVEESLLYYTASKVDIKANALFVAFRIQELIKIICACRDLSVPFLIFGTGSKIILEGKVFEGLVIKNRTRDIKTVSIKGKVGRGGIGVEEAMVEVDSGVSINKFSEYVLTNGLSQDEFMGITGSFGGNIFINEILQNRTKSIKVLDQNSSVEEISVNQLALSKHIVLSLILKVEAKSI